MSFRENHQQEILLCPHVTSDCTEQPLHCLHVCLSHAARERESVCVCTCVLRAQDRCRWRFLIGLNSIGTGSFHFALQASG